MAALYWCVNISLQLLHELILHIWQGCAAIYYIRAGVVHAFLNA